MKKDEKRKEELQDNSKSLESLIDAQLDSIVVGGFSRTVFSKVKPD
jgi:hypothetical protein